MVRGERLYRALTALVGPGALTGIRDHTYNDDVMAVTMRLPQDLKHTAAGGNGLNQGYGYN